MSTSHRPISGLLNEQRISLLVSLRVLPMHRHFQILLSFWRLKIMFLGVVQYSCPVFVKPISGFPSFLMVLLWQDQWLNIFLAEKSIFFPVTTVSCILSNSVFVCTHTPWEGLTPCLQDFSFTLGTCLFQTYPVVMVSLGLSGMNLKMVCEMLKSYLICSLSDSHVLLSIAFWSFFPAQVVLATLSSLNTFLWLLQRM